MPTELNHTHYGEIYTVPELIAITGRSPRTFRRWRDAGILERIESVPLTYYVVDADKDNPLKPIDLTSIKKEALKNSPADLTEDMKDYESVSDFLKAADLAKKRIHLVHKPQSSKHTKILVLSDLHCPFHNEKLIKEICEQHLDAESIVLNGDILDAYAASSFAQEKLVTILEEYNSAMDLLRWIAARFKNVFLTRGNHDQRVDRYFSKKLDPHMFALGQRDILWKLSNGYVYNSIGEHVGTIALPNVYYNMSGIPWIAQIGKTVFMHPHSYGSKQMQTAVNAQEYLENFIDRNKFDSIVLGHTHKVGKLIEKGKLLLETGCLTELMDYQKTGVLITRPQSVGYGIIYQDASGNTNFNDSNFVYCGVLTPMR